MTDPAAALPNRQVVRLNDLMVVAGYEDVLRTNGLDSLDALFNVVNAESLSKPGLSPWRERLRLTLDLRGERRPFYLKRFTNPPLRARREVRRSGSAASSIAGMEWSWMHRLEADGIPCVKPVAFGEAHRGLRERRSALLTEAVPGESLERWVMRWSTADRATIRRLIAPLARIVARFHECGYIHRDLYLSHVFFNPAAPLESSLCLIDLQRVFRPRWRQERWVIKDLASLNFSTPSSVFSKADRLRWLTHYLGESKLDASMRRVVYRIMGKTRRIARHERRRRVRRWRGSDGR